MQKVMITGLGNGYETVLAHQLKEHYELLGIHANPQTFTAPKGMKISAYDLRQQKAEALFADSVYAVIHIGAADAWSHSYKNHKIAFSEFKRVLSYCQKYAIRKLILLSGYEVYGAFPKSPMFLKEHSPLKGNQCFPKLDALLHYETASLNLFWELPKLETVILRPVNVLGPHTHGILNTLLQQPRIPTIFGFDPLMQVIHENDVALAILHALTPKLKGVFNVGGPGELGFSDLIQLSGSHKWSLLEPVCKMMVQILYQRGKFPLPSDAMSFVQHMVTIDSAPFTKQTNFRPAHSLNATVAPLTH